MNNRLEAFKDSLAGKRVAVLGIGISNTPLIKYLSKFECSITAFDKADPCNLSEHIEKLKNCKIEYSLGESYLDNLKGFDIIFKTPVIRHDIPELIFEKNRGALITSEIDVLVDLCPALIYGVTGSDGKTTTTTLIYLMLKQAGFNCWLGGNIGIPLLDKIDQIAETDKVVLELSSFQLMSMKHSPDIAVITNITPNHLDIHLSLQEYIDAKKNIFKYQDIGSTLVLNRDDRISGCFGVESPGKVKYFSKSEASDIGAYLYGEEVLYNDGKSVRQILDVNTIRIPGIHNIENYMAAIAATADHVSAANIRKVASSFKGVEHRLETVRELNGVTFINDSIASSPNRTIAGLNSFKQKVILIAGGKDKNLDYSVIGTAIRSKVKYLVLAGETSETIEKAYLKEMEKHTGESNIEIIRFITLEKAVEAAYKNASTGDIVLFSPASTSFDMFKNFEKRGEKFKEIVNNLK